MFERLKYWIWLASLDSMGPRKMNLLLDMFGDPLNLWHCSPDELKKISFLNENNLNQLADRKRREYSSACLEELKAKGIRVITIRDPEYPELLRHIYDPPAVLFVRGTLHCDEKMIAIVGSRKASAYGAKVAYTLAYKLSKAGFVIISGMAKGIDTQAHRGALEAGGRTVAVLGCGIDNVYPPENRGLAERIVQNGAVASEYLPGSKPMPYNFPARNRIISGMSLGTIVVEAGEKSGSLITAGYALDQGREVFAVPGNIDSMNSVGTNRLIKEGAKPVTDVKDVLEEFGITSDTRHCISGNERANRKATFFPPNLSDEEKILLKCLAEGRQHIDIIAAKCGMDSASISALLTMMELSGFVHQLPGKYFEIDEKLLF